MCVLAVWTFAVLGLVPLTRIRAARAGRVKAHDFRYGESANVPDDVLLPNRDYMNLLELPMLFYAICLALYATKNVDDLAIWLACGFVGMRIAHSLIHLTYNNVMHRLFAFAAGMTLLAVMWIRFALSLT